MADERTGKPLPEPLARALVRLYGVPLDEFIRMRRDLVNELKAAGEAAIAKRVAEAKKPPLTAWALNQVARGHPALVRAFFGARGALEAAQSAGGGALRDAMAAYRKAITDVVSAAERALRDAGSAGTAAQLRTISETLQAIGADAGDARAELVEGRLADDVSVDDPFGALAEGAPVAASPAPEQARPRHAAAPAHGGKLIDLAAAREAARAAKEREREAREARVRRERAIEDARRALAAREEALEQARAMEDEARAALAAAQAELERAVDATAAARAALDAAREALEALEGAT